MEVERELVPESLLGAAPHKSLWPHVIDKPLVIRAKFLNGTVFQKQKVMYYARQWNKISAVGPDGQQKIRLQFMPEDLPSTPDISDIRIRFSPGGSSSYIGSDARNIRKTEPTVFFGWIDENTSEEEIRQVVLHEFGHVLGLVHEHQSPSANIPWNKDSVYAYYHRTQRPPWSKPKVDSNIFYRYSASQTNYSKYDSLSIMHYAVPSELTIGGFSTPWNSNFSQTDSSFIKTLYNYYPCVSGKTCCWDKKGKPVPCR